MRLTDLDPGWLSTADGRNGMGVTFDCPHCHALGKYQKLGVWFANPVDGGTPAEPAVEPKPRWQRAGETFETLTLTPSIDASASGHWHGWITSGDVR
jgi:hypothetical protein